MEFVETVLAGRGGPRGRDRQRGINDARDQVGDGIGVELVARYEDRGCPVVTGLCFEADPEVGAVGVREEVEEA